MRVCLKVDVEDVAGYKEGLPSLLRLLDQYSIRATFLFSLGYDNTGLRLKNLFNPSVLTRQLPLSQKLYGTLMPPPFLARKYKALIRDCAAAGHDIGIKSFDSVDWQFHAAEADKQWTRRQLDWSIEQFAGILGFQPEIHSASGYVINEHLLMLQQEKGFRAALDTRGKTAYKPEYRGVTSDTVQVPVTLPGIEELLLNSEINLDNVHEYLFSESQQQMSHGHIFNIRASIEGRAWLEIIEKMIVMWRGSQWEFNRISDVLDQLDNETLITHQVGWAQYKPHHRYMATQGIPLEIQNSAV